MYRESLKRTRQTFFGKIAALLGTSEINDESWDELEALLIQADLGMETALAVTDALKSEVASRGLTSREQLLGALATHLRGLLVEKNSELGAPGERLLSVVYIVGVNGSGKTTTIGKLAKHFSDQGWNVLLAAADTFRAAAVEQLNLWGERLDIPVISGQTGGDAGAVVYDSIRAARARNKDLLIVDTAGRLHTKHNLMDELKKVYRVAAKNVHDAPHAVWLIVDGTTGQNALVQAEHFKQAVNVTGVILTKLDGTANGGMAFAIGQQLDLPIVYLGVGEGEDDLLQFDPEAFVSSLLTP